MQNTNSVWKLTALAGVVGLGLLIVLQAQRFMDPKTANNSAQDRLADFKRLDDLEQLEPTLDNGVPVGNTEPQPLTTRNRAVDATAAVDSDDHSFDDLPPRTSLASQSRARNPRAGTNSLPPTDLADSTDDPFADQPEPTAPPPKTRAPRAALMLDELLDETTNGKPNETNSVATESDPNDASPFGDAPARQPKQVPAVSLKKQAQQLIAQARRLLDAGNLDEARAKAIAAFDLGVSFGALEDSPEAVLADIDRAAPTPADSQGITLTGGVEKSAPRELTLDAPALPMPSNNRVPKPAPLDDVDNLLADNPPPGPPGKKRLPDPPVPPAEEPASSKTDNSELLDLLNDSSAPAKKPAANQSPEISPPANRRDTNIPAPLELDEASQKLTGEGVVRPDAPRGPQRPELKIEKVAPPNATLGQPMVYTILIKNVGDAAAHQVLVEDQVPKGTSLSGTIPRAEMTGKKLIWRLGTIKPGEQKEISVKVVPLAEGQVGSVATVAFHAEVASRTTVSSPKLAMKLTAAPQARIGETVTLNFQVTNNGTADASRVVLRNLIPDNLKLPDVAERDLEYEIGSLPAGKTQTVQLPLSAIRPGKAINKAILSTEGAVAAETQVEINVVGQLIGLIRHGPTSWYVNRPIEIENRLTNNSLSPAINTVVVESLPSTVEFVSASDGGRFDQRQRTVTWHVPQLSPQETQSLKIKVTPKSIGNHAGSIQITESGRKGAAVDYQFKALGAAVLGVEFSEKSEAYSKGEQITLKMHVRNKGSGAASNVAVRVTIPAELKFVSARGPVSHTMSGQDILFEPITEIGGQGNVAFDLTLQTLTSGDTKLQVELQSEQFRKPLTHEEPIIVFAQ